jgi:cysteine dioxygenase
MATIVRSKSESGLGRLLSELDDYCIAVPEAKLRSILRGFRPSAAELAAFRRFSARGYRRNLIHTGPGYQAWLLCWKRGQFSPIHDHTGSGCGVRVIQGVATEARFERRRDGRLTAGPALAHPTGSVIVSIDSDIHVMGCRTDAADDLVSLHIYTPPLTGMKFYPESLIVPADREKVARITARPVARPAAQRGNGTGRVTAHSAERAGKRPLSAVGKSPRVRRA